MGEKILWRLIQGHWLCRGCPWGSVHVLPGPVHAAIVLGKEQAGSKLPGSGGRNHSASLLPMKETSPLLLMARSGPVLRGPLLPS